MSDRSTTRNRFFRVLTRRGRVSELTVKLPPYAKPLYAHVACQRQSNHANSTGILASYYHPDLHAWIVRQSLHNRSPTKPDDRHSDLAGATERSRGAKNVDALWRDDYTEQNYHRIDHHPLQQQKQRCKRHPATTTTRSPLSLLVVRVVVLLDRANMYDVHIAMSSLRDAVQLECLLELEHCSRWYKLQQQEQHQQQHGSAQSYAYRLSSPSEMYGTDCAMHTHTCANNPCRPYAMVTLACMLPATGEYILTGGGFVSECAVKSSGPALPDSQHPFLTTNARHGTTTITPVDCDADDNTDHSSSRAVRGKCDTAGYTANSCFSPLSLIHGWVGERHSAQAMCTHNSHTNDELYDAIYIDAHTYQSTSQDRASEAYTSPQRHRTTSTSCQRVDSHTRTMDKSENVVKSTPGRFLAWSVRAHAHAGLVCFALGLRRRRPQDWSALALASRNRISRWAREWSEETEATVVPQPPNALRHTRMKRNHANKTSSSHASSATAHGIDPTHDDNDTAAGHTIANHTLDSHTHSRSPMHSSNTASLLHSYSTRHAQLDEMIEDGCGSIDATTSAEESATHHEDAMHSRLHSDNHACNKRFDLNTKRAYRSMSLSISPFSSFTSSTSSSTPSHVLLSSLSPSPSIEITALQHDRRAFLRSTADAKPVGSATPRHGENTSASDKQHRAWRRAVEVRALQHGIAVYFGPALARHPSQRVHASHGGGGRRARKDQDDTHEGDSDCYWTIVLPPPHSTYTLTIADPT